MTQSVPPPYDAASAHLPSAEMVKWHGSPTVSAVVSRCSVPFASLSEKSRPPPAA